MRAAARVRPLLLLALLLCCGASLCDAKKGPHRASRTRDVRTRVSVGGKFSPAQRAELRQKHDAGWANVSLARTCGKPPVGYDPPQWRRDPPPSRRVQLRGWLVCNAAAGVYESLFALPGPAFPTRDEAFTAAFKGRQRTLSISPADGVGRLVRAARTLRAVHCLGRTLTFAFPRFRCFLLQMSEVEAGDWIPLKSFSYEGVPLQGQGAAEPQPEPAQAARDASEL